MSGAGRHPRARTPRHWVISRVRRASRAPVALVAAAAVGAALWVSRTVLLLGFCAVLLAVVLSFPVGWVQRVVRRRGVAVIAVLLLAAGAAAALGSVAAGPLSEEAAAVLDSAPRTLHRARDWVYRVQRGATGTDPRAARPGAGAAQPPPLERAVRIALPAAAAALTTITEAILVVVVAAFLVNEPDVYRRGLRRLVPRRREELFDDVWTRLRHVMRRWVGGTLVSMAIMGCLAGLGLFAAGIDDWGLLGTLTFLGTFVPYLGAVASAVPGLVVAAGQSPRHLLLAALVYAGVHLVEGYLVQPLIMRRAVELKPALLLAGEAVFGAIFGILGVVVATPMLVCLHVVVDDLWVERRLGKAPGANGPGARGEARPAENGASHLE